MIFNESRMLDVKHAPVGTLFKVENHIFIKTGVSFENGSAPVIYMTGSRAGKTGRRAGQHQQVLFQVTENVTKYRHDDSIPMKDVEVGSTIATGLGIQIVKHNFKSVSDVVVWDIYSCMFRYISKEARACIVEPEFQFISRDVNENDPEEREWADNKERTRAPGPVDRIDKLEDRMRIAEANKTAYDVSQGERRKLATATAELAKLIKSNRLALDQHITDDADQRMRMRKPNFAPLWVGLALATPGIIALIMEIASYVESH
jgi:hypothetical protein